MKIPQEILEILDQGKIKGNVYQLPPRQLDRETYLAVDKVLKALGGKWNRRATGHVFKNDPTDAIEQTIVTGEAVDKKQELGFFETPYAIARLLVEMAQIETGQDCLEPSAGKGRIADLLIEAGGHVKCVEIDNENSATLREKGFVIHQGDFLEYEPQLGFDRIVMNPPFGRQQDLDHVSRALDLLNDGGILVAVMSAGVSFRQNKRTKTFQKKLRDFDHEITRLPENSFKESGTQVSAIILKVQRIGSR